MKKKNIISFSGLDSSGKGTQIILFEDFLKNNKVKYTKIWARGSWTPGVELIKKIVRQDRNFTEEQKEEYRKEARSNPKKQRVILILSILDLLWFWGIYYRWINFTGKALICDRYIWDTLVDFRVNFSVHNFEKWMIWKILLKIIPKPTISYLFVITAQESYDRGIKKEEAHMETFEKKLLKSHEYKKLIDQNKWTNVIDGNLEINKIQEIVQKAFINENR
jgi:dTMP kinase